MCIIINDKEQIRWCPDSVDGYAGVYWKEAKKDPNLNLPTFASGDLYISNIAFFIFSKPDLAFDYALKHRDLTIWMGDADEDAMREAVAAHSIATKPTSFNSGYYYSGYYSFLVGYARSNTPFMILEEKFLTECDSDRKIHMFHILNEEKTGWIYTPNKEVFKIKKWKM